MSRLKEKYEKEIVPQLMEEFSIANRLAVPKLTKIIVNTGIGDAINDKSLVKTVAEDLGLITGQRPSERVARISVAGFSLRQGSIVGLKVTLRKTRMYDFLDRLISIVLPRLRDFRGLSLKSFDKEGNYTLGVADYSVFPEINLSKISQTRGLEITIVIKSRNQTESRRLLETLGMPFEKED